MSDKHAKFNEILDNNHQWPCPYSFKFIVPSKNLSLLVDLFPNYEMTKRESKNGKYTSVTLESTMCSGKEVMAIYELASQVPGIMSL